MAKTKKAAAKKAVTSADKAVNLQIVRGNYEARYKAITGDDRPVSMGFIEAFRKRYGDDDILNSGSLEQIFAHYEG
jgi:hypothetical protein